MPYSFKQIPHFLEMHTSVNRQNTGLVSFIHWSEMFLNNSDQLNHVTRVRSDKYRPGIITIVPVRTASVKIEKYR